MQDARESKQAHEPRGSPITMTTPRKLINASLRLIGAQASGESLGSAEAEDSLEALNMMLDSWSTTKLLVPTLTSRPYTARGPHIPLYPRPMRVLNSRIRENGIDFPVTAITREEYQAIPEKTLRGRPVALWWDQAFPDSSIRLYPAPNKAYTLYVETWERLAKFGALDECVELPGEFFRALKYSLAVDLAPEWGTSASPKVIAVAKSSQDAVVRYLGNVAPVMTSDLAGTRSLPYGSGRFNWRTGL